MLQDGHSFRELWQKFMEQQLEEGSLQLANEYNLELYMSLFYSYVGGKVPGQVLVVSDGNKDVGIYLEGVIVGGFELTIGSYTMLWGCYLLPEYRGQGITHKLYEMAMEWTYEQGFTGGITGILVTGQSVSKTLKAVVDDKRGASPTHPYTIEVCWEFKEPSEEVK